MRVSQGDLADYLGVARATLSQATSKGHRCKGYPVRAWAVYDGSGRVAGYDVPTHVMKQASESIEGAEAPRQNPMPDLFGGNFANSGPVHLPGLGIDVPTTASHIDASQRTSLLPEGEDYFRPVSSGGAAYVMGTAIEHDTGTARGALLVAGTAIGSLTGWQVSDRSTIGALVGAGIGYFAAITGLRSMAAGGEAPRSEPDGMGGQSQLRPPSHRVQRRGAEPSVTQRSTIRKLGT